MGHRVKRMNALRWRMHAAITKRKVQRWKDIPGNVFDAPSWKHYIKE